MKKTALLCTCFFTCIFLPGALSAQQINAEEICVLSANLIRPPAAAGTKIIYSVTGGNVTSKIKGRVLPVEGDFATFISPTTLKLDVRLVIRTDDSSTVYCTYAGYLHTNTATYKLIKAGKGFQIDPSRYYFRTNPIFETDSAKYNELTYPLRWDTRHASIQFAVRSWQFAMVS